MGLLDLMAGIFTFLIHYELLGWRLPLGMSLYLVTKSYAWKGHWTSMIDGVIGVYIIFELLGIKSFWLTLFFGIYLSQKAIMSWL